MNYKFPDKYEVFRNTHMYNEYRDVFEQNIATLTPENNRWYNGLMDKFITDIKCGNIRPDDDCILAYITCEDICIEHEPLFIKFIAEIYDKLLDLRTASRKLDEASFKKTITKNSHIEEDLKKEQKAVERNAKQEQKAAALIDAAIVRNTVRLHKETREDKKASDIIERRRLADLKKETQELARLASIAETVCECGFIYIFNRRSIHMGSDKHRDRMDGIQYCKQLHGI